MSRRGRHWRSDRRKRWRKSVTASPHYSAQHRRILDAASREMDEKGLLQVARQKIAEIAGVRQVQRVSDAYSRAVAVGHLIFVTKMAYGQPTRYQGTFPNAECNELCSRLIHHGEPLNTCGKTTNLRERKLGDSANQTPPVVNGKTFTIRKTPASPDHVPDSASPDDDLLELIIERQFAEHNGNRNEASTRTDPSDDFAALGLKPRDDLADLIQHTSERFAMPDERSGS